MVGWYRFLFFRAIKTRSSSPRPQEKFPDGPLAFYLRHVLSSNTFVIPAKHSVATECFCIRISMPLAAWVAKMVCAFTGKGETATHIWKNVLAPGQETYAVVCFAGHKWTRMVRYFLAWHSAYRRFHGFWHAKHHDRNGALHHHLYGIGWVWEAVIWTEVVQGIIKSLGRTAYFIPGDKTAARRFW